MKLSKKYLLGPNENRFKYRGELELLIYKLGLKDRGDSESLEFEDLYETDAVANFAYIETALFIKASDIHMPLDEIHARLMYHTIQRFINGDGSLCFEKALEEFNDLLKSWDKGKELPLINYSENLFLYNYYFLKPEKSKIIPLRFTGVYSCSEKQLSYAKVGDYKNDIYLGGIDENKYVRVKKSDFLEELTPINIVTDFLSYHQPTIGYEELSEFTRSEIERKRWCRRNIYTNFDE